MRALHVAGLGWSGSSAIFEFLREHTNVETVSAGRDGETCTSVKELNPVDFRRAYPAVELGATDVVHLLTGGRLVAAELLTAEGKMPRAHLAAPQPWVAAHLAAHPRYCRMNQKVLVDIEPERFAEGVEQSLDAARGGWDHATTRLLLRSLAAEQWPGAKFLMFNNDPWLPGIEADDLDDGSVFIVVVRRAESQFADFVNKQMIAKRLRIPGRRALWKWLQNAFRARRHLRILLSEAQHRGALLHVIRFEDFVVDPELRRRLTEGLGLEPPLRTGLDFNRSQANIRVRASIRTPWWLQLSFPILDALLPRPTL